MNGDVALALDLEQVRERSRRIGFVLVGLCGLGAVLNLDQFFRSYLLAYLFWLGIALGCLPLMMLHHQSGGAWGLVIRRLLEAATRTLPMMALWFLPIVIGVSWIYVWARPDAVAADPVLEYKSPYLNVPFFVARAAVYFAAWIGIALTLNRWSLEQDRTAEVGLSRRMQVLSGAGIVIYGLTISFAAVDWVMSLDPHWFSTIFGALWISNQALNAFCFAILALVALSDRPPLAGVLRKEIFQDLGGLLLAFVMVWTYLAFSQYLIIWAGNLAEEVPWYLRRSRGGWQWLGLAIIVFHFAIPFLALLSKDVKRRATSLAAVALLVFVMRFVDLFWTVAPNFHEDGFFLHWMDILLPVGLGGLWLSAFLGRVGERPLLPLNDPYLPESLGHGIARG